MKSRVWRNLAYGLGLLALICAAGLLALYAHWSRQLSAAQQAWRKRGLPVTPHEWDAWYAYPDGPNPALTYADACAGFRSLTDEEFQALPIVGDGEEPSLGTCWSGETLAMARGTLLARRENLDRILAEKTGVPSRYPVDLTQGITTPLNHLAHLRLAGDELALLAVISVHEDDGAAAAGAIAATLRMAQSLESEPIFISQLTRHKLIGTAMSSLERTQALVALPADSAREIRRMCQTMETSEGVRRAIVSESAMQAEYFAHRDGVKTLVKDRWETAFPLGLAADAYEMAGLSGRDAALLLRRALQMLDLCQLPFPERLSRADAMFIGWNTEDAPWSPVQHLVRNWRRYFQAEARALACLRIMRTALALDQYAQAHGTFPETLAALVPEFLDAVPEDPQTGAPLTYRHEADGCIVYAFGDNGVDDGGAVDPSGSVRGLSGDIAMRLPKRRGERQEETS